MRKQDERTEDKIMFRVCIVAIIAALPLVAFVYPVFYEWMNLPIDRGVPFARIVGIMFSAILVTGWVIIVGLIARSFK